MDKPVIETAQAAFDLTPFYGLIGAVVVAQFGTIVTVITWLLRATWKASAMNSDIERLKADVNAAHQKIRTTGIKSDGDCAENDNTKG